MANFFIFANQLFGMQYRRLARRGGVRRISNTIYNDMRDVLKEFLQQVRRDSSFFLCFCLLRLTFSFFFFFFALWLGYPRRCTLYRAS